jgi:hypothetical protein
MPEIFIFNDDPAFLLRLLQIHSHEFAPLEPPVFIICELLLKTVFSGWVCRVLYFGDELLPTLFSCKCLPTLFSCKCLPALWLSLSSALITNKSSYSSKSFF